MTRWSTWRLPTPFPVVTLLFMNRLDNELTWLQCVPAIQWKNTSDWNWIDFYHYPLEMLLSTKYGDETVIVEKWCVADVWKIPQNEFFLAWTSDSLLLKKAEKVQFCFNKVTWYFLVWIMMNILYHKNVLNELKMMYDVSEHSFRGQWLE